MGARIAVGSAGIIAAGLGSLVMAGWWMQDPLLVRVHEGWAPMSFNGALCVALLGAGLLAGVLRVRPLQAALGVFVSLVALATFIQYPFALDLGLDELVVDAWARQPLMHAGRMPAVMAALLLIAGIAVASSKQLPAYAWAAGCVVAANGLLLAIGHLPLLAEVARWTGWAQVALHASLVLAVIGAGLVALSVRDGLPVPGRRVTMVLLLVVATMGVNLWQALVSVELARVASETGQAARSLALQLHRDRDRWVAVLARMAHRLEREPGMIHSGAWEADAKEYVADTPGLVALAIHDARGFVVPPVTEASGFAITPPAELLARSFRDFEPVIHPGLVMIPFVTPDGPAAVVASVSLSQVLRGVLETALPGYGITLMVDEGAVYERYPGASPPRGTPVARFTLNTGAEGGWQASVWPHERLIEGHRGPLPLAVLVLSLVAATLVAVSSRSSRRLRAQQEIDAGVWRESVDVLCLIDPSGRFVRVSDAAERMWGYRPEQLEGTDYRDIVAPETLDETVAEVHALEGKKRVTGFQNRVVRADGTTVPMSWSSVWAEQLGLLVCLGRDFTDQVEYEEELERRVAERTHELTLANAELEAFSYSVSHDLRTPLRAIAGFTELLRDEVGPTLDDRAKHYLKRVLDGTDRMSRLIDDLLRLGRLSRRDLEIETVDLTGLAERIAANLKESDPARSVDFRIDAGLSAEADPHLMELVIENLFGNAWKFTAGKDPAVIEFSLRDGAFTVCDNGVGFDMQYAGALFGVFQRLHGIDEFPGTGIGLATVKRIVERHGGEVWAHGETGQGARFHFTLG